MSRGNSAPQESPEAFRLSQSRDELAVLLGKHWRQVFARALVVRKLALVAFQEGIWLLGEGYVWFSMGMSLSIRAATSSSPSATSKACIVFS